MELNKKQQKVLDKAQKIFGDKINSKNIDIVEQTILITYDIDYVNYTDEMVKDLFNDVIYPKSENNLYSKYIIPPYSIFDTKSKEWKDRKKLLDDYFGGSLVGRKERLAYTNPNWKVREDDTGTSQFDSLLCEIVYKWFGFDNCKVYDPFAGGHIRGLMAAKLGYRYFGIDLNKEQIEENKKIAEEIKFKGKVKWVVDDSLNVDNYIKEDKIVDLIFSCPPYADLEKYTDDKRDLSNMEYKYFKIVYSEIIKRACKKLKDDSFVVFVVSDARGKDGLYYGIVKDTILAFEKVGLKLYNEIILLNNIGTAAMRASNTFSFRKVVRLHQNVLVFYKGDIKRIKEKYNNIDCALPFKVKSGNQQTLI